MDNSFQTSFIPKKPVTNTIRDSRPPTSLSTVISVFILIVVGGGSVGLFLYKNYLINQKNSLSASLQIVRKSFENDTITELGLYDKRVSAAQKILSNHIVLSPLFTKLGALTIPSIQYTNFAQETTPQGFNVKITGIATDYKSIALQADVFNSAKGRSFKNVIFSNLVKDKNNNITFNMNFTVDPNLLSYQKNTILEQAQSNKESFAAPTSVEIVDPSSGLPSTAEEVPNNNLIQ